MLSKISSESNRILIHNRYSEKDLLDFISFDSGPNFDTLMYVLDQKFPIEFVRERENLAPYTIYKTAEGGTLYCFYYGKKDLLIVDNIIYMKAPLSKSDFSSLKAGDNISSVEAVDPGFKKLNEENPKYLLRGRTSYHLLKDGLLQIDYSSSANILSEFTISKLSYYRNDSIPGQERISNYSILSQDYIQ